MRVHSALLAVTLSACSPSKSTPMWHSIEMHNEGARVYNYEIDYGNAVLPSGRRGHSDFDGTYVYTSISPLPEEAVASWRTEQPPAGEAVTFHVPIRDKVTDAEWSGEHFVLEFASTPTTLEVYVTNGVGWPPASRRLIYSESARPHAP